MKYRSSTPPPYRYRMPFRCRRQESGPAKCRETRKSFITHGHKTRLGIPPMAHAAGRGFDLGLGEAGVHRDAVPQMTFQCPPLSGPTRTKRPDSRSVRIALRIALSDFPSCFANSGADSSGFSFSRLKIAAPVFPGVFPGVSAWVRPWNRTTTAPGISTISGFGRPASSAQAAILIVPCPQVSMMPRR